MFLTFSVILVTLVGQGLTMPLVIGWLGLEDDGVLDAGGGEGAHLRRRRRARAARGAGRTRTGCATTRPSACAAPTRFRKRRFAARFDDGDDGAIEERSISYQRLRRELLAAERQAVFDLRRNGKIGDDTMRLVERDLDLEDSRLDA